MRDLNLTAVKPSCPLIVRVSQLQTRPLVLNSLAERPDSAGGTSLLPAASCQAPPAGTPQRLRCRGGQRASVLPRCCCPAVSCFWSPHTPRGSLPCRHQRAQAPPFLLRVWVQLRGSCSKPSASTPCLLCSSPSSRLGATTAVPKVLSPQGSSMSFPALQCLFKQFPILNSFS